jgi:hypothetical protein
LKALTQSGHSPSRWSNVRFFEARGDIASGGFDIRLLLSLKR